MIDLTNASEDDSDDEVMIVGVVRAKLTQYERYKAEDLAKELAKKTPARMPTAIKALYFPV